MSIAWKDLRQEILESKHTLKGAILGIGIGMPDLDLSHQFIWHEVFMTGEVAPDISVEEAVEICCMGWAACHMGCKPPANFGIGTANPGQISGCMLPEDFSAKADEIIKEKNHEQGL